MLHNMIFFASAVMPRYMEPNCGVFVFLIKSRGDKLLADCCLFSKFARLVKEKSLKIII